MIRCWLTLLISLLFMSTVQASESTENTEILDSFLPVGSGELTFMGMTVYRATLLAPDGRYQADRLHALKIKYEFSFSSNRLAWSSVNEMEPMLTSTIDRYALYRQLNTVLRDVTEGDHIIGLHHPGTGAAFYSEGRLLGRLEDPEIAAAFFSIWLDPRTREPDLRARLLGTH